MISIFSWPKIIYFNALSHSYFQALRCFLTMEQTAYDCTEEELGTVLSGMSIYTWANKKPADPAVWELWEMVTDEMFDDYKNTGIEIPFHKRHIIKKEQAFMAAFNMLDQEYWEKNHDITLGEVVGGIENCLIDLKENKKNLVWDLWVQCLKAEEGREYNFSFETKL